MHKGDWAIHEVLPSLLSAIGPAKVKIMTFSISEDSLRPLFFLADERKIESLTLLLDMTVKRHKLDLLLFASNISPSIRIDSCHAKLLLVENIGNINSGLPDLQTLIKTTDGKMVSILPPENITNTSHKCLTKRMKMPFAMIY